MVRLGKFLRQLRIEHSEILYDMARRLQVSSAFLSAVENGKRSAPVQWIEILTREYRLGSDQQEELTEAVYDSIKQVRVDVGNVSVNKRNCAIAFARTFDDMSDEDIQGMMSFLERRKKSE